MPSSTISKVRIQQHVGATSFNLIPGGSTLIFEIELLGSNRISDLRFGHDTYIGPLTVLMGINGADLDPEDPYEVKNIYQNWETCKVSNVQLVFYRGKKSSDEILVKCLLNGDEAKLPVPTDMFPYYKWSDFRQFYQNRIDSVK